MVNLTNLLADLPGGFWQTIIGWFADFITSYGWTIIVFTVVLKLVLSPLDFWQKLSMRKTQKQQALIQPELDKIKEKYGNNKEVVNQKTMELYQKNKISPMGGCLGMLVNLVLTMVIFFTLFGAMNNISQYKVAKEYDGLKAEYVSFYNGETTFDIDEENKDKTYLECIDYGKIYYDEHEAEIKETYPEDISKDRDSFGLYFGQTCGQLKVENKFNEIKESWLWIKNIFRPDNYASSFPNYNEFLSSTGSNIYKVKTVEGTETQYYYQDINGNLYEYIEGDTDGNTTRLNQAKEQGEKDFNLITLQVRTSYGSWNGYFILVILAAGSTLLGQLLANAGIKAKNKKGEDVKVKGNTNLILMIVLPLIMGWFTWNYSSIFAIYIIVNSLMSALIGYIANLILNKVDEKKETRAVVSGGNRAVKSEIANMDYRIEKKGKIESIIPDKKEKKSKEKGDNK
ncbi:MAG: YidC/Oxa1 family membrane protein insertase [Clostridiales bacterium]|nr:YidC/Oxa1 family membrane protein insertase [Candidatus Apopatousia equi]